MEVSALPVGDSSVRQRRSLPAPLLRLRSDEQLVHLFRAGNDEAFSVIHDRYRQRLFAYTRHMLPRHLDADDALQDVFMRVYSSLRRSDYGVMNLRPWLYRAAHNRCIDELRRQVPEPQHAMAEIRDPTQDPAIQVEEREALRHILDDVRRLPDQQRSALLLRELAGVHYVDIALALDVTVPAVKSLLVRARVALATSAEARETGCATIREELALAQDSNARLIAIAKAHLRDCQGCREFRDRLQGTSKQLSGLVPALGPLALVANALGIGGAWGASGSAGAAAGGAAVGGGAFASVGALTVGHGVLIAAVVATGGAIELQRTIATPSPLSTSRPAISATPAPPAVSPMAPTKSSAQLTVAGPVLTTPPRGAPAALAPPIAPSTPVPQPAAVSTTSTASPPALTPVVPIPTPIRQPSITGIGAVSTTSMSSIGRTSITGTSSVSGKHPAEPAHSGGTGGSPSSSTSTAGTTDTSHSGNGSSASAAPSTSGSSSDGSAPGSGSPTDSSPSPQDTSSGTSSAPAQSSSGWGTTSVTAVSN